VASNQTLLTAGTEDRDLTRLEEYRVRAAFGAAVESAVAKASGTEEPK